jgi:hypothetical protein
MQEGCKCQCQQLPASLLGGCMCPGFAPEKQPWQSIIVRGLTRHGGRNKARRCSAAALRCCAVAIKLRITCTCYSIHNLCLFAMALAREVPNKLFYLKQHALCSRPAS